MVDKPKTVAVGVMMFISGAFFTIIAVLAVFLLRKVCTHSFSTF